MTHHKNNSKMMIWMLIGCFVVIISALAIFGKSSAGNWLWIGFPLICVVMHFGMMGHGKDKDNHH